MFSTSVPRKGEVKDGQWLGVSVQSQGTEEEKQW